MQAIHNSEFPLAESYRSTLAAQFRRNVAVTRPEIFGLADNRCAPTALPDDAATMFAGYVGEKYRPSIGLLLLAINPGGGGDAYTSRTAEDGRFFPLLERFKASTDRDVLPAFEAVNQAFPDIVRGWNLWRILGPTLAAAGRTLDEVAYMNVVPYRTRGDKMPPVAAQQAAWNRVMIPSIELLNPRAIVTLGMKAGGVVDRYHLGSVHDYCVPRTIGDSRVSPAALAVHDQMRRDLL